MILARKHSVLTAVQQQQHINKREKIPLGSWLCVDVKGKKGLKTITSQKNVRHFSKRKLSLSKREVAHSWQACTWLASSRLDVLGLLVLGYFF